MIYKVATGDLLFDQTAKIFSEIKNRIQEAHLQDLPPDSVYEEISRIFWRSAVLEFQMKVALKEKPLKYINAAIPPMAMNMFKSVLHKENKLLSQTVELRVDSQKLFSNEKNRQYLLQASHSRLHQFKADLESKNKGAQQLSDHKAATMNWYPDPPFEQPTATIQLQNHDLHQSLMHRTDPWEYARLQRR